jgi:hypothetical protein
MSAIELYKQVRTLVGECVDAKVDESTRERISLLVTGIIGARNASPARVAQAIHSMGLRDAQPASLERQIRRLENDPEVAASLCFHRFARTRLLLGRPQELTLILDPTMQEDRVVMASVAVWYRGRALPLVWAVWPGNEPLKGDGFWTRIAALLDEVAPLLPSNVPITWLADRAFGTPAFIDLVVAHGWHYIVRLQGQTRCRDRLGRQSRVDGLVAGQRRRAKLRGEAFKSAGWRSVSVVVYWGRSHRQALCLASDLKPGWWLIHRYRSRYAIETSFRDYKSAGWQWESGQVTDLVHLQRLLIAMAFATWLTLLAGTLAASRLLSRPPTGNGYTRPFDAKHSLFYLGLDLLDCLIQGSRHFRLPLTFSDWDAPNWQTQLTSFHAFAFIFHPIYATL